MTDRAAAPGGTWDQADPERMAARLRAWAPSVGAAGVEYVARMPGHSGISHGFDLVGVDGTREALVIRVPPHGVRRSGTTDVLRQVPLLELLVASGVSAPRVRASGDDERWFGTPYLVVERVAGAMPGDIFAGRPPAVSRAARDALFDQAMDALARIHAVDVGRLPVGWAEPARPAELVDRWLALLERSEWPGLLDTGRAVHAALRADAPEPDTPGLVHGDFYQNNWMAAGERLTAVLDWESAHLGPTAVDVGYVAMMYDPASWDPALRGDLVDRGRPEDLVERYASATGRAVAHPGWYRALAGLRLAALTAYFVRLHRTGRRRDDTWDLIGPSAPFMLARAAELAGPDPRHCPTHRRAR